MTSQEAKRAYWRMVYHRHRDKKLEWCKNSRTSEQKAKSAAYQREWRKKNKEYLCSYRRLRYARDPERVRQQRRDRYVKDREKIRERYYARKNSVVEKSGVKKPDRPSFQPIKSERSLSLVPCRVIRPVTAQTEPNPPATSLRELAQELFSNIIEVF